MASQSLRPLRSSSHVPGPKAPCDSKLKMVSPYECTWKTLRLLELLWSLFELCPGVGRLEKEYVGPSLLSEHGNSGIKAGTIPETTAVQEQESGAVWRTQDAVCIDPTLSCSLAFTEDRPLDSLLFPL